MDAIVIVGNKALHDMTPQRCGRTSVGGRGLRGHSNSAKSEVSVVVDFKTKSVKKLVVQLLARVDLGLCPVGNFDVLYDFLFTALEFSTFKNVVGQGLCKSQIAK